MEISSELDALGLDIAENELPETEIAADDDILTLLDNEIAMDPVEMVPDSVDEASAETSFDDVESLMSEDIVADDPIVEEDNMDALLDDILADADNDIIDEAELDAQLDIAEQATVANDPDLELVKSLMAVSYTHLTLPTILLV